MYIANATGCSSIWGNSSPSTPYTVTPEGKGPAWCNSLFEDNAEFGYGMLLAQNTIRDRMKGLVAKLAEDAEDADVKAAAQEYLDTFGCGATNGTATDNLVAALEKCGCDRAEKAELLKNKDFLAKKSQWVFGGDGWAYDIGFGGVDHVLASGQGHQHHGIRYRGLLQHRRTVLQGYKDRCYSTVRSRRKRDEEERPCRYGNELRIRIRCTDRYGC